MPEHALKTKIEICSNPYIRPHHLFLPAIPHSLEEVLEYVLKAGVNALEMRSVLEEGLGIPAGPARARRCSDDRPGKAERAKAADAAREEQRKWRLSFTMQKYADIRQDVQ